MSAERDLLGRGSCEQLFTEISAGYHAELRRLALRLTCNHHDAEDLVQDVLVRLFVHRYRLPHVTDLRAWLYRVTYNQFVTRWRRRGPVLSEMPPERVLADVGELLYPSSADPLTGPERCAFLLQLRDFTAVLLEQLSPQQHQILSLHDLQGLSLPEIADRLDMSVNTLKSSLTRARSRLRSGLAAYDPMSARLAGRRRGLGRRRAHSGRPGYRRRAPKTEQAV